MRAPLLTRLLRRMSVGDGCWEWTGKRSHAGYGSIGIENRRSSTVHRVAYLLFVGEIPDGLEIDHLCRNRACVRPDHLEAVTRKTNILRSGNFIATQAKATHCPHGHSYLDTTNLYSRPDRNGRMCRTCMLERSRKRYYEIQKPQRQAASAARRAK